MVPTNNINVFIRHNDTELRSMFTNICCKYRFSGNFDDLVQDFYYKLMTSDILQKYNRHFTSNGMFTTCKMSSYLYPMIKNHVVTAVKSPDYKYLMNKVQNYDKKHDLEEIDTENMVPECQEDLIQKELMECPDSLRFDLKMFFESFENTKSDKRFAKKVTDETGLSTATLSRLFKLIYMGYSNKEIAKEFGVTTMYIFYLKQKLAKVMKKYGF